MPFATRFAPSPTGYLHRGHAFSALTAFEAAQAAGGRFVLRIEDIDTTRCRPEFEAAIYEGLAWLGLEWEKPVRRQSEHMDAYRGALDRLVAAGLVFCCFKTRREILDEIARAPHGPGEGPNGLVYRGAPLAADEEAQLLAEGRPYAWRLSLDRARERMGEARDRLSFVEEGSGPGGEHGLIRARPEPTYRLHRLLTGPDGKRFAKRDQPETLRELRARGVTPDALKAEVGLSS